MNVLTTNFLATVSALSKDLRNDDTYRVLIPLADPELNARYHFSFLKSNLEKIITKSNRKCYALWVTPNKSLFICK